jgi:hypothetical protein
MEGQQGFESEWSACPLLRAASLIPQERQRAQQERAKAVEERDKAVAVIAQVRGPLQSVFDTPRFTAGAVAALAARQQAWISAVSRRVAIGAHHRSRAKHLRAHPPCLRQVASLQAALMEAQATVAAASAAAAEWKDNFLKERAVRRQLHEQLQVCCLTSGCPSSPSCVVKSSWTAYQQAASTPDRRSVLLRLELTPAPTRRAA